jgi:hypothetical protein
VDRHNGGIHPDELLEGTEARSSAGPHRKDSETTRLRLSVLQKRSAARIGLALWQMWIGF